MVHTSLKPEDSGHAQLTAIIEAKTWLKMNFPHRQISATGGSPFSSISGAKESEGQQLKIM